MRNAAATAGELRGPENLYDNVTRGAVSKVDRLLPATKGEVHDVKADIEDYRNQTTTVLSALVGRLKSLIPVGSLIWHACRCDNPCNFHINRRRPVQVYNGTSGLNGINGTSGAHTNQSIPHTHSLTCSQQLCGRWAHRRDGNQMIAYKLSETCTCRCYRSYRPHRCHRSGWRHSHQRTQRPHRCSSVALSQCAIRAHSA